MGRVIDGGGDQDLGSYLYQAELICLISVSGDTGADGETVSECGDPVLGRVMMWTWVAPPHTSQCGEINIVAVISECGHRGIPAISARITTPS